MRALHQRMFLPPFRALANGFMRAATAGAPAREVTIQRRIRLFLDSNVLMGGIVSPWGLDKAVRSLCAAKV